MWSPTNVSPDAKRALVVLAVGHFLFIGIAVGGASVDHGELGVDLTEIEPTVSEHGNVTAFTLRVRNTQQTPINPIVRVHHEDWHIQNAWATNRSTIPPGETVSLRIHLDRYDHRAAPNVGTELVLILSNASTQERRVVGPFRIQTNETA